MMTYGYEKLMKIFAGDWSFADPIGLGEGLSLILTVFGEFFCSILIIVGFMTRPALIINMIVMTVAAFIVHADDPFTVKEHALTFLTIYSAIFITGPGRISMDARLFGNA
jgi:putative oxidoreductase